MAGVERMRAPVAKVHLDLPVAPSSAMPLVYRDFPPVDGRLFTDGGLADPLPVKAAVERSAVKIMVVRSRLKEYRKKKSIFMVLPRIYGNAVIASSMLS